MTFKKMRDIMQMMELQGIHGDVDCSGGGELRFTVTGQPSRDMDYWMRRRGFIINEPGEYIYRPR
jgi:hypothetical protein